MNVENYKNLIMPTKLNYKLKQFADLQLYIAVLY